MSTQIELPDFTHSKHSSQGREERINFIMDEVKKNPDFNYEGKPYTKERCKNLVSITDTIDYCLRMMMFSASTRRDYKEQILMMLKLI